MTSIDDVHAQQIIFEQTFEIIQRIQKIRIKTLCWRGPVTEMIDQCSLNSKRLFCNSLLYILLSLVWTKWELYSQIVRKGTVFISHTQAFGQKTTFSLQIMPNNGLATATNASLQI